MHFVGRLRCVRCSTVYPPDPHALTCPRCAGEGQRGILDVEFDTDRIARATSPAELERRLGRDPSIWSWIEFLPVDPAVAPPAGKLGGRALRVGGTPLYRAARLGEALGLDDLWIKDDGQNPTGSLKDRASAVGVARAVEAGFDTVACASTGNAASSLAGSAAAAGLRSVIFVPKRAPQAKVAQLLIFGATVLSVQADYDTAYELSTRAIGRYGWYNRNAAVNPYLVEGKKTVGLEIAWQLGWRAPDWLVFSVGDGCTIYGAYKAFVELRRAGFVDRAPRMLGVQAEGSAPIAAAFHGGGEPAPVAPQTIADSIAVGAPRNPEKAIRAARDSGGTYVTVSDREIYDAMRLAGRLSGVFAEPAGATALAGLQRAVGQGIIGRGERVVCAVTGNGLKDVASAIEAAGQPIPVEPDFDAVIAALEGLSTDAP